MTTVEVTEVRNVVTVAPTPNAVTVQAVSNTVEITMDGIFNGVIHTVGGTDHDLTGPLVLDGLFTASGHIQMAASGEIRDSGGTARITLDAADPHVTVNPAGTDATVTLNDVVGIGVAPDPSAGLSVGLATVNVTTQASLSGIRSAIAPQDALVSLFLGLAVDAAGNYGASYKAINILLTGQNTGAGVGDSGTATATAASVITDSTKSWTVNQWTSGIIAIAGQSRVIATNTATSVTVYRAFDPVPGNVAYTITFGSHSEIGGIVIRPGLTSPAKPAYVYGIRSAHGVNSGSQPRIVGEMVFIDIGDYGEGLSVREGLIGLRISDGGKFESTSKFGAGAAGPSYGIYIDAQTNVVNVSRNRWTLGNITSPAASAYLDIGGTTGVTGALLISRLTTAERDAMTEVEGMIVFNTTTSKFQGFVGGTWADFH